MTDPRIDQLSGGGQIFWLPAQQYVTHHVKVWLVQPVERRIFSSAALLSSLLRRGSRRYPDQRRLVAALEELWGADLHTQVNRVGSFHLTSFYLNLADGRFLPAAGADLLTDGLQLLQEMITSPYLIDGLFPAEVFDQEQQRLQTILASSRNNRSSLAAQRMQALVYGDTAYGVPRYGTEADLLALSNQKLMDAYHQLLQNSRLIVGLCGDGVEQVTTVQIEQMFNWQRQPLAAKAALVLPHRASVEKVTEVIPGEQSQLLMAFSSQVGYEQPASLALFLVNGLYGGFAHSRLFRFVREEAGLAYATGSSLDRSTGVLTAYAGLEAEAAVQAAALMSEQMQRLQAGDFSEAELEMTRQTVAGQLRMSNQEAEGRLDYQFSRFLKGHGDVEQMIEQMQNINRQEIIAAAQTLKPHTVYLLADREVIQ